MQKSKTGKNSIFNFLDIKLEFLTSRVELIQFSVELSRVELKIWATQLKLSWKYEQFDSISIQVQNVNLKSDLTISLINRSWMTFLSLHNCLHWLIQLKIMMSKRLRISVQSICKLLNSLNFSYHRCILR